MTRVLVSLVAAGALFALSACVVQQPTSPAARPAYAVAASAQPVSAGVAYSAPAPVVAGSCGATLAVSPVQTRPGCEIDERVSAQSAAVSFPCGGGPAQAAFSDAVFGGTVSADGTVDLSIRTTFAYRDGCQWETKQEIRGALSSGTLSYAYFERPLEGQRGCARGCEAAATVRVANVSR